jgi:uncharacterized tellurite resistance protein B-like protein
MLFGTGSRLSGMFATHPPLTERIRALEPNFNESDYPHVTLQERDVASERGVDQRGAGIAAATSALASGVAPAAISASVGRPSEEHIAFATRVRQSFPESLYDAAHSSELSYLLVIALILDGRGATSDRQLSLLSEKLGEQRTNLIQQLHAQIQEAGPEYRLPLLEISFPALRQRPVPQLSFLLELTARLIDIDGEVELHEFCFYRVLAINLRQVMNPSKSQKRKRAGRKPVRDAAVNLLRIVAQHGHADASQAEAAFRAGLSAFGDWGDAYAYSSEEKPTTGNLEKSIDQLVSLNAEGRQMLLDSVTQVVLHDDELTVAEAELVRTVCASLEIPLPPQIGVSLNSVRNSGSQ